MSFVSLGDLCVWWQFIVAYFCVSHQGSKNTKKLFGSDE